MVLLKPDCLQRGLAGVVVGRIEARGFKMVAARMGRASMTEIERHYEGGKRGHLESLASYMSSGPVVAMVWQGQDVVKARRLTRKESLPPFTSPASVCM